jgi:glutamyl-tRNA reductase
MGEAMSLVVVGLSHHSTPVEIRERFAFGPAEARAALTELRASGIAREAVLLSTCNRTEFYLHLAPGGEGEEAVLRQFAARAGLPVSEAADYIYSYRGRAGVEHLFRVVTSLDSMIVGEAQIQGQVRAAYEQAAGAGAAAGAPASGGGAAPASAAVGLSPAPELVGPVLSRLFQTALAVGGRVRSETALGVGAASIPSAAVALAKKIFGSLRGRRALVLGAGEMGELALESLVAEGVEGVVVASRTRARAEELAAKVGGRAIGYEELAAVLPTVEIVAAATAAPHLVLTRELFQEAFPAGPRQQMLMVDIAIPRDIDPSIGEFGQVFLYDIDDLRQIVDDNLERRRAEVPVAERIVAEMAGEFWEWHLSRGAVPLIRELRDRAESVRRTEVEKALRRLQHLEPEDREAVDQLTRALLNKILHQPTVRLREAMSNGGGVAVLHAARYLFELEDAAESTETRDEGAG